MCMSVRGRWEHPMPLPLDELRLRLARHGAQVLYAHGAAHVWVFGSLGSGRARGRRSDIDLAVDGMSGREADAATPAVERAIGCHVDVLSLDEVLPVQLRSQVLRSRVLLPRGEDGGELRAPSRWYGAPGRARQLF